MALTSANTNQPISEFHQLVRNFGTTAQRPTLDLITGQTYFDTTLGSWIYWDGSTWITNSGSAFPVTGLVDGQRFWHTTYRSWFVYNLSDTKWRQEAPGVFGSSFPTVAAGDNTVAPGIEVKRRDLNNRVYFWNGTVWLPVAGTWVVLDKICRVYDDSTSRATGYSNTAVQVTGVTDTLSGWMTMPSTLRAVEYNVLLFTAAAGTGLSLVIENPDASVGARVLQGATVNDGVVIAYSGGGVMSLSALGKLSFTYTGSANLTRIIINILASMT